MRQQARTFLAFPACFVCAIAAAATPEWIARSNSIAQPILESRAKLNPEQASFRGLDAFDTSIGDVGPGAYERKVAQLEAAVASLRRMRDSESDTRVKQDIAIMIGALDNDLAVERAEHNHLFEYLDAMDVTNGGLSALLDPRNKPDRQARALVRLKRYAGREPGYTPLATLARQSIEQSMADRVLVGPYVERVKQNVTSCSRACRTCSRARSSLAGRRTSPRSPRRCVSSGTGRSASCCPARAPR